MRCLYLTAALCWVSTVLLAQNDSADVITLSKETTLSEVVIRNHINVVSFLRRVKEDTGFYKAFRNLRILGFTSVNDIKMLDKQGGVAASLFSKTRQTRKDGCRTMEVLEEKTTGDMYSGGRLNYFTAGLYASLFFTKGKICGETNIVAGIERSVGSKKGMEKAREQLKMLYFNPGKKIPGIPFIGDKIDIFDPDVAKLYDFSIDIDPIGGQDCYLFVIKAKPDLSLFQKGRVVFDNITTWFNIATMQIVARNYDLSYHTPVYDFDVHMEVQMKPFGDLLVPAFLRYKGNWKVALKKRERGEFNAILSDFKNE